VGSTVFVSRYVNQPVRVNVVTPLVLTTYSPMRYTSELEDVSHESIGQIRHYLILDP
jgi:hypothetical protein